MAQHNALGKWGEETAASYLHDRGYIIRCRDWRFGSRDIDIVAVTEDLSTVVFVEVKTRTTDVITKPEDAIDARKMRNVGIAANAYVKEFNVQEELRFDIITIVGDREDSMRIEHIEDAFNPLLLY